MEDIKMEDIKMLEEMAQNCLTKKEYIDPKSKRKARAIQNVLDILEKLHTENLNLKLKNNALENYIVNSPHLNEITADKFAEFEMEGYARGRAEENTRLRRLIFEEYIPKSKIRDKIYELEEELGELKEYDSKDSCLYEDYIQKRIKTYKELLGEEK